MDGNDCVKKVLNHCFYMGFRRDLWQPKLDLLNFNDKLNKY